ncbi:MAG: branched-chain-amino-acid transaminase [Candidatus Rokubacteria bacterium]|nr:branched-chain-amino-acid transaminase [Candidatus Rokubacteria bacterium]
MGISYYIDGKLYPKEEAKVSVLDHGFLYGDGVFEGIRAYNGRVFRLEQHLDRLWQGARTLMLQIPLSRDALRKAVLWTLRENKLRDAYIRLVVTRGVGDLGLDPRKCPRPSVIIITDTISLYPAELYERGMEVVSVSTRKNRTDALNPNIKCLNYLNQILGRLEVNREGAPEGIMLNQDGHVAEATADNIFMVLKGILVTPPAIAGILLGITRETVLELAVKEGIPTEEKLFGLHTLYNSEECFLTGTGAEVVPVVKVDGRTIGAGVPGEMTRRIIKSFRELVQQEGTPIDG